MAFALFPTNVGVPPRLPPLPRASLPANAGLYGGEVNFLFWFKEGRVMDVEVRWTMRKGWGLRPRDTRSIAQPTVPHDYSVMFTGEGTARC